MFKELLFGKGCSNFFWQALTPSLTKVFFLFALKRGADQKPLTSKDGIIFKQRLILPLFQITLCSAITMQHQILSQNIYKIFFIFKLCRMLGYQEPLYPLRTKFVYSNYMYVLAGFVAEKMGGKPWETLVKELLFEPLGMRDSGFVSDVKNFTQYPSAFAYVDGRLERVDQNLLL